MSKRQGQELWCLKVKVCAVDEVQGNEVGSRSRVAVRVSAMLAAYLSTTQQQRSSEDVSEKVKARSGSVLQSDNSERCCWCERASDTDRCSSLCG
jgi:hypothetical protein